jgi:hypothetical protein
MRSAQANAKAKQQIVISASARLPVFAELDRNDSPERISIGRVVDHAYGIILESWVGMRRFTIKFLWGSTASVGIA